MELKVRDVFANAYYRGKATERQINNMHDNYGCKSKYKLGHGICKGRGCVECFDTPMDKLEEYDKR